MLRTLFAKILVWSVVVQLITVAVNLALVTYYLPESQHAVNNAFKLYADTAVTLYERFGPKALDQFLAQSGASTLLNLRLSTTDPGASCGPHGDTTTSILARGRTGTYCLTVHAKNGGLPESPESRRSRLQITILLELINCAGLSYFIARYLSRPISELRLAARRLAVGDLGARVGARFSARKDEAAELVRDFDRMADRVSGLIETQRRLIGDVSHEIKSPLARLNVALGLARRDAEDHAPRQFARMQKEIDTISQLVGELLTLASLDTATAPPDHRVDLGEVVGDVVADIAYEMPARARDLSVSATDHPVILRGDRTLLARAIGNVVRNAVFYTAPGAAIEIGFRPGAPVRVRLTIRDHGPGVPEKALGCLFDPFYRVDDARTRRTGGSGIGLAICRRAVELHGGTVHARNVTPHGLEIVIDLPQMSSERDDG